jgi:hypothetical protein
MQPGTYLNHDTDGISYSDFINNELILFSRPATSAPSPSVADGLKPDQREVIWACFKRKLKKLIKVGLVRSRFSDNCSRCWKYSSGPVSLGESENRSVCFLLDVPVGEAVNALFIKLLIC